MEKEPLSVNNTESSDAAKKDFDQSELVDFDVIMRQALEDGDFRDVMDHFELAPENDQGRIILVALESRAYEPLVDHIDKIPEKFQLGVLEDIANRREYKLLGRALYSVSEAIRSSVIDGFQSTSSRDCAIFLNNAPIEVYDQFLSKFSQYQSSVLTDAMFEIKDDKRSAYLSAVLRSNHANLLINSIDYYARYKTGFSDFGSLVVDQVLADENYEQMGKLLDRANERQLDGLNDGMFDGDRWGDLIKNYDYLTESGRFRLLDSDEYHNAQQIMEEVAFLDPSDCFNGKICSERIFSVLGKRRVEQLIYYKSPAIKIIDELDDESLNMISSWLDWLENSGLYQSNTPRLVNLGVVGFDRYRSVCEQLMERADLSSAMREGLICALESNVVVDIKNLDDLENYPQLLNAVYADAIRSDEDISKYWLDELFSSKRYFYLARAFDSFNEKNLELLVAGGVLTQSDADFVTIVEKIYNNPNAPETRQVLRLLIDDKGARLGGRMDIILKKVNEYMGRLFKQELYAPEGVPDEILEFENHQVSVYKLQGQDFKILQHAVHCFNKDLRYVFDELSVNPSVWNRARGASTISTNLVASDFMRHIASEIRNDVVVMYGFADFADDAILFANHEDIGTDNESGTINPWSNVGKVFTTPDDLVASSIKHWSGRPDVESYYDEYDDKMVTIRAYNEVALWRFGGADPNRYAGRIQPSYVVSYGKDGSVIDESSLRSAVYFKVPIVLINDEIYKQRNENEQR